MMHWRSATLLYLAAVTAAPTHAESPITESAAYGAALATSCADGDCRPAVSLAPIGVVRTSERARAIARKLDATGYYSRYSRALKGYPHLRSKRDKPPTNGALAVNSENRRRFRSQIQQIALKHSLDYVLIDAVILVESAYNPNAVSPKGAMGLMQLMPDTAKRFEVADPFDPADNINGGTRYLRWLMQRFDGDLQLVLAAYNAGEGAVANNGNQIPPYAETQAYVQRVLGVYKP
jgi:soluble lytic murein transglycosylase-like protein